MECSEERHEVRCAAVCQPSLADSKFDGTKQDNNNVSIDCAINSASHWTPILNVELTVNPFQITT